MSTNISGTINNFDGVIESNEDVVLESNNNGGFVIKANGHNLNLASITRLVLRKAGVSEGAAEITTPGGESRFISSDRSPGANDRADEGTVLTPVYQGKAANEEGETSDPDDQVKELPEETPSTEVEASTEAPAEVQASPPEEV